MPTFNLKHFCRADGLAAIQPTHLLRLLRPYRAYFVKRGVPLPEPPAPLDFKSIMDALITPDGDTPVELIDALYYIHEMSTSEGMDLLLREFDARGCNQSWFGEYSAADVAVKAWLDNPDLLQRMHAQLSVRDFRSYLYFRNWQSQRPRAANTTEPIAASRTHALEARLSDRFGRKNRGRGVRVFRYPQADQTVWYLVRHGEPFRRENVLRGGEHSSVAFRPLKFDVVIFDPTAGELRVHAKAAWEVTLYRTEFGLYLLGDMNFFSPAPKYTLEPLRTDGPDSLRCAEVSGIRYVSLKEVHLLWGGKHKELQIHRANGVFEALRLRETELPKTPALVQATFAVRFADSREPRHVTIRPPNTAVYSREEDAHLVEQWLQHRGFVMQPERPAHDDATQEVLASA